MSEHAMNELKDLQQSFMAYLLENDGGEGQPIVQQIESTKMMSAEERMGIYGNAYVMRLKEALATDFERLHGYLGDEQFDQLLEDYIARYPSHTFSLRYFGAQLPEMLKHTAPYNELPQLYELALIEQSFANSFDSENTALATLDELASIDPECWPCLRLQFVPSQQTLALNTNSFDLWKALANEENPAEVECYDQPQVWSVWRKADLISHYRPLSAPEQAAVTAMANDEDFSSLCALLLEFFAEEEVPQQAVGFLQSWIMEERVAGLCLEPL